MDYKLEFQQADSSIYSETGILQDVIITVMSDNAPINIRLENPGYIISGHIKDLDQNSRLELYLVANYGGSGEVPYLYRIDFDKDGSHQTSQLRPRLFPEDYQSKGLYDFTGPKLRFTYPLYSDGDANCCPSAGVKTVTYDVTQDGQFLLVP